MLINFDFQVLQSTFLKSNSALLCSTILDAISSIYHSDNANYFILENQNTLSQFTEKIHHKPAEIQLKLFELIEFLVYQLNFVPCKELISMSIFLKTHSLNYVDCSILCMQTLLNILKHNIIFKDVYREVGMLEVFVTCLNRYSNILEEKKIFQSKGKDYKLPTGQEKLGGLVVEALTILLASNGANANVLRECGGAKCVHGLVQYIECRYAVLGRYTELVLKIRYIMIRNEICCKQHTVQSRYQLICRHCTSHTVAKLCDINFVNFYKRKNYFH